MSCAGEQSPAQSWGILRAHKEMLQQPVQSSCWQLCELQADPQTIQGCSTVPDAEAGGRDAL